MLNLLIGAASIISIGATGLILWRAIIAERAASRHALDAERHSQAAQCAALAPQAQPLEAPLILEVSEVVSQPETPKKSRRELVAEAARSPENLARMAAIGEHRARTSPLIPGNNPLAQTDVAEFRKRHNKFK
ncbi:MAG: hypothetical protein ACHQIK_14540 [Candidatus Acidiferrales bacterium]